MSFAIEEGDFVAIIGQSGSGKSTLMNILGCLDTQSSGVCRIGGVDIGTLDSDELAELRGKRIGFIFQRYNLLSTLSATENVALPAVYSGVDKRRALTGPSPARGSGPAGQAGEQAQRASGGQQQRVSIARALMNGGSIILADEPTGALDSKSGENVMDILTELNRRGHTIIVVTHDHHIAGFASRVIEIKDGSIISRHPEPGIRPRAGTRTPPRFAPRLLPVPQGSVRRGVQNVGAGHPRPQDAVRADHARHHHRHRLGGVRGRAGARVAGKIIANISSMGTNTINVYPGQGFGDRKSDKVRTLTVADSDVLGKQSYIDSATPNTTAAGTLVYRNITVNAQLSGVGEQY